MPTTGAPWNIWYPDNTSPISPLENLFSTLATSVAVAFTSLNRVYALSDLTAVAAKTGMIAGDIAITATANGGLVLRYDGTIWVQINVSSFASASARDTEYAKASGVYKVQPAQSFARDTGITWRWFDLYNVSTNPTGRATAGWAPWNTSVPVSYYAAANLVNYTVGPDVPIMTWSAREGRILCEGKLQIVSGSSFSGAFAIKVPSTIPVAAKYATTGRQDIVGKALYVASSQFPIDVVLQGSTATDRVLPILENQTGTYPAYATQITASVPVANVVGYVLTWSFEYDPA